jgi:hypothetical protein
MLTEAERWKAIAFYLADCHAATAEHEGALSRTRRSSRLRFRSICEKAIFFLSGNYPRDHCESESGQARILERLKEAMDEIDRKTETRRSKTDA